uniref:Uncharacterized protein LOC111133702 n=1 Tax=Crassostrea virginica TaxID=6565 RepID=A0A8B8EES0_CRAVI|nr:uncharacterized protein LOC111133702 [Crassostrea virginica]
MACSTLCLCLVLLSPLPTRILPQEDDILAILHESCRFEIHTSRLQWDSANQACIQRGLTLASLADISEVGSLFSVIKQADSIYSNRFGLESSNYWIGLRRDVDYSYHWGDCVPDNTVTKSFSDLSYKPSFNCALLSGSSVRMTKCSQTLGFICENPQDSDSCFTTFSTTAESIGYDSVTSLTSSVCASSCLMSDACAGVFVSSGSKCTMLSYSQGLKHTSASTDLESTHFYHRRLLYTSTYRDFTPDRSVEDICNALSVIVTTGIADTTVISEIHPTTTIKPTNNTIHVVGDGPTSGDVTVGSASTNPSSSPTLCTCVCRDDNETTQQKIYRRNSELTINKHTVSKVVRTKLSAANLRKSSRYVGFLGVGLISLSFLLIVSLDFPLFVSELRKIIKGRNRRAK